MTPQQSTTETLDPQARKELGSSFLTRTRAFKRLSRWAYRQCCDENRQLGKKEVYTGILLIHLTLARYAGPAACYPPSRAVVERMFQAADDDNSGHIEEPEFTQIMMVCCVDIVYRILVYWLILILLVPYMSEQFVLNVLQLDEYMGWNVTKAELTVFSWIERLLTWNDIAERVIGLALFFLVIPFFFDWIDQHSTQLAQDHIVVVSKTKKED